jgi:hypothetical protein
MSESLDLCSTCKAGYVKPTGEVLVDQSVNSNTLGAGAGEYTCARTVGKDRLGLEFANI